jgi:hypothetical protein
MTVDKASNDESLDRALIKCLRLFAKHGRKIRNENLSPKEVHPDGDKTEKETKESVNCESVQVNNTTDIQIEGKVLSTRE